MAYTTATPLAPELQANGSYRFPVDFSGAGVPVVREVTFIDSSTTAASLKEWAISVVTRLNSTKSVVDLPAIVNKTPIDLTPVAPTADEIAANTWGANVVALEASKAKLARFTALGVTTSGALQTAITALTTSISNQAVALNTDYNAATTGARTLMQGKL